MFETKNLYQNDPEWKNVPLGNQAAETIGSWGCLLTSMTMVLVGAGYEDETPESVNAKMKANGGFQGALIIPAVLPLLYPNVTFRGFEPCESHPAPLGRIDQALAAGKPVIAQVDWNPDAGIQTHWIVLKERKGDDYVMYDPYKYRGDGPDKELLVTKRYKYQGTDIATAISGVVWYEIVGAAAKPPKKEKVPVPDEKFTIYVGEDDLALRSEPAVTGYLYKRMMFQEPLISLESKADTLAKIGQMGQWVHVQDSDGDQGYTAAWYVSKTKGEVAGPPEPVAPAKPTVTKPAQPTTAKPAPATKAKAGEMVLAPTEDNLALRTKPVIAPETQIRRVPMSERFIVAEPLPQGAPKIGVQGQWIKVRDSGNKVGYVAAWYVRYVSGPPPGAFKKATTTTTAPTAPAGALKVHTTAEAVSLRSQPVISDATLIKHLPLDTVLEVLEPGGEAKIGVTNQWLKVKDPKGAEGYVAAWYVTR
jgi:hypothetical protein